ncbi:F-box domain-containing protein [Favolaschia claudopus]|uniref:F-box domain-containing protein n=1 Tax=Favolaschia claudopus TaxID=2862362 RepID=A0AAW0AN72_9AGAR
MLDSLKLDRAFLAEKEVEIRELEDQISALEKSIDAIRAVQQRVKDRLNAYKYPVLTLPNEITTEIFLHFLPPYPDPPPLVGPLSPITLTQICRTWREIATATPALWSAINLAEAEGEFDTVPLANLWLPRAGNCLLSMKAADWHRTNPIIIPYCNRWEHLALHRGISTSLTFDTSLPFLRTLHVSRNSATQAPSFSIQNAPLLREVKLPIPDGVQPALPWAQLTSLVLYEVRPNDCATIIRQTLQLISLRCEFRIHQGRQDQISILPPNISLLQLKYLVFDFDLYHEDDFLAHFVVPSLQYLRVPEGLMWPHPIPSLTAFIQKSGCKLQELYITYSSIEKSAYRTGLPSIPSIERSSDDGGFD